MTGWTCSVCGEANAPTNKRCVNGPHAKVTVTPSTFPHPAYPPWRPYGPWRPVIGNDPNSYVYSGPPLQAWNAN